MMFLLHSLLLSDGDMDEKEPESTFLKSANKYHGPAFHQPRAWLFQSSLSPRKQRKI